MKECSDIPKMVKTLFFLKKLIKIQKEFLHLANVKLLILSQMVCLSGDD